MQLLDLALFCYTGANPNIILQYIFTVVKLVLHLNTTRGDIKQQQKAQLKLFYYFLESQLYTLSPEYFGQIHFQILGRLVSAFIFLHDIMADGVEITFFSRKWYRP